MGEIYFLEPLSRLVPPVIPLVQPRVALGYCYSAADKSGVSLELQALDILAYCGRQALPTPKFHVDRGPCEGDGRRPAWKQLMLEVVPGAVVVVRDSTRLSRDGRTLLSMIAEVQSAGGTVRLVEGDTDYRLHSAITAAMPKHRNQSGRHE